MKWINRNDSEANFEDRRGKGRGKRNAAVGGLGAIIDKKRHLVLQSVHPSPLSAHRGFFGVPIMSD